jgi:hypothetical protein
MEIEPESSPNQSPTDHEIDASQQEDQSYCSFPPPPTSIVTVLEPAQTLVDLRLLPVKERAISLCVTLLERLVWMFSIVSNIYLFETVIPAVYDPQMDSLACSPHDLALLSAALAIGALVDLRLGPNNEEAQRYIRLAWSAARSLRAVPTIATVKCLHLMSIYHGVVGNKLDCHRLLIAAWERLHHVRFIFQDFTAIEADIGLIDSLTCVAI